MKEQDLDRLMEQERPDGEDRAAEEKFQKKVRKTIKRTMYSHIFISLLVVILAGTAVFFGLSAAVSAIFYDPGKETGLLEDDMEGSEFTLLLEETIAMYYPGMRCMVLGDGAVSTGFSGYDVDVLMESAFDRLMLGGPPTNTFHIGFSKLDTDMAPFYTYVDEFIKPEDQNGEEAVFSPEGVREDVEALPESAQLDVSISFDTYLTSDQVAQLMKQYPDVFFQWVALKGHSPRYFPQVAGGMNLHTYSGFRFAPAFQERYEGYYLPLDQQEITGEDLERSLIARLRLLADNPDFVRMMESKFKDHISIDMVEERLALAEQEWSCYGLRMEVGRQELLDMMDELPITRVMVNDVKLSRLQRS